MFQVDEDAKIKVSEMFGRTKQMAEKDINDIKKWMECEKFPEIMSDVRIRSMLNLCKYDCEKTKKRIKVYYDAKKLYPRTFDNCNPKLPNMKKVMEAANVSQHPTLLDGIHRIIFLKLKDPDALNMWDVGKLFFCLYEIRLEQDLMTDDVIICDINYISLKAILKFTPYLVYKNASAYKNVFAMRMKACHLVNCPPYISILVQILKFVLPPKLFGRIHIHRDVQMLKEILPDNVVPSDFGGSGLSLDELDALVKQEFHKFQERFDELDRMRGCENKSEECLD